MRLFFTLIVSLVTAAAGFSQNYKSITAVQADTLIKNHAGATDLVIIDVRTSGEFVGGWIEKARNYDVNSTVAFNDSVDKLDKNKIYLVYCASGSRSPGACNKLFAKNIKTIYNLTSGISAWKNAGFPVVKSSSIDLNAINSLVVKIYPNPVVDLSTLEINGFMEGEVKIEILNALGSLVMSRKMVPGSAITLNGRELSPGFYFYRLVLPQNQVKSGRFQVAR